MVDFILDDKVYRFSLKDTIECVRHRIINDLNVEDHDIENITDKIYRNFGKMVLYQGSISRIYDNKEIGDFLKENQTVKIKLIPVLEEKKEPIVFKTTIKKEPPKEFFINMDDFPPL